MKKLLLFAFFILIISCERQRCWECEVNQVSYLSNLAYVNDTILYKHRNFIECDMTTTEIEGIEDQYTSTKTVDDIELLPSVYHWEGIVLSECECEKQ